jgi:hypothetical protein
MLEDTRNEKQAESFAFAIESIVERERERERKRESALTHMQVRYLVSFSGFFLGEETTQKPKKKSIQKERETATEATNKSGEEEEAWEGRRPGWGAGSSSSRSSSDRAGEVDTFRRCAASRC